MNDNATESQSLSKSSGDGFFGLLFRSWFVAYLVPGVALFLIKGYFDEQERLRQQEIRDREIRKMMEDPEKLGPALKILFGLEQPPEAPSTKPNPKAPVDEANADED
jgi:hypothetical protein